MRIDRQLILVLMIWAVLLIARGIDIISAHSPCIDDNYHLYRGLLYLRGDFAKLRETPLNDPPLGEALSAIPAWLHRVRMPDESLVIPLTVAPAPQYCFSLPREIRYEIAIWKALLFLPMAAVVFSWVRTIHGLHPAWLASVLLMAEPTLAAHLPLPTVDVLGVEGIVIACWTLWRFVQRSTIPRGAAAALALAVALLLKHTALLLPGVFLLYAAAHCLVKASPVRAILPKMAAVGAAALLVAWLLMQGDISAAVIRPGAQYLPGAHFFAAHRLPLGTYLGSIFQAIFHDRLGHRGYLWGEIRRTGWWYYFPSVALYKMPIGIAVVLQIGIASLLWKRGQFDELALLIPAVLWGIALSMQKIDIGFRHFLPPYVFLIMLSSRCLVSVGAGVWMIGVAWLCAAISLIHTALWMPDELSYINFRRERPYLAISDSNLDWGQSIDEIRNWIQAHPEELRPIYVGYFGPLDVNLYAELGPRLSGYSNRVFWLPSPDGSVVKTPLPERGILILSPVLLTGQYEQNQVARFTSLQTVKPVDSIGCCMLVYDLDRMKR